MPVTDLKSTAADKLDESMHAMKRVVRQRTHDLEDLRDAAALKVRRSPLQAVAIGLGSGLLLGFVMGLATTRARSAKP
jgi:ElaB/YqjD/DUF883 family membrane-anchored ribosome-binding protein